MEWQLDFADLGLVAGEAFSFRLALMQGGIEREAYPEGAPIRLAVPEKDFGLRSWIV